MHDQINRVVSTPIEPVSPSDLADRFAVTVNLLGGDVVVADAASLGDVLSSVIGAEPDGGVAISSDLAGLLPDFPVADSAANGAWDIAITRGRVGVTATGSVLIVEPQEADRSLPMLARKHVVLLPADALVPSLADTLPTLQSLASQSVRYWTFVSGPSRTADIEKILTIGAHGPRELVVVLLTGWSPADDSPFS